MEIYRKERKNHIIKRAKRLAVLLALTGSFAACAPKDTTLLDQIIAEHTQTAAAQPSSTAGYPWGHTPTPYPEATSKGVVVIPTQVPTLEVTPTELPRTGDLIITATLDGDNLTGCCTTNTDLTINVTVPPEWEGKVVKTTMQLAHGIYNHPPGQVNPAEWGWSETIGERSFVLTGKAPYESSGQWNFKVGAEVHERDGRSYGSFVYNVCVNNVEARSVVSSYVECDVTLGELD